MNYLLRSKYIQLKNLLENIKTLKVNIGIYRRLSTNETYPPSTTNTKCLSFFLTALLKKIQSGPRWHKEHLEMQKHGSMQITVWHSESRRLSADGVLGRRTLQRKRHREL